MTVFTDAPDASPLRSSVDDALEALSVEIDGTVLRPTSPRWDDARAAWQLSVDQRPLAVVVAESERDVALTLRLASRMEVRVAPQSGGHGAGPLGDLSGAILLRTSRLDAVAVDPRARTATVGAGATWGQVAAAAAPHGLAGLAGSSTTVGVVGYCLGGGIGWLGRLHGLGAGTIESARVALPGGTVVTASSTQHADLWWALRGGGGAGIVTEVTLRLFDVPRLTAGTLWWPAERARDVLRAWARLLPDLPREISSAARVLHLPDIEDLPPHLRGGSFVIVQAAVAGSPGLADRLLEPLRALSPVADDVAAVSLEALGTLAMDPVAPSAGAAEGLVLTVLTDEVIDAWLDTTQGPACTGIVGADLRHLGGALAPAANADAALPGLDGEVAAMVVAPVTPATTLGEARGMVGAAMAALAPWASAHQYANFVEHPVDERELVGGAVDRLATVRLTYDPDGTVMRRHG